MTTHSTEAGQKLADAREAAWSAYRFGPPENRGRGWHDASPRSAWDAAWDAAALLFTAPEREGAGLREALGQIACLSPEPDNKAWTTEPWGDPANYQIYDDNGSPQEIVPDCDDKADLEAFGYERGLHRAAVIARAALGPPVYSSSTLTPPADPKTPDAGVGEPVWRATCGVCDSAWKVEQADTPSASGTFCPDCRERGLMAPGVLNWRQDAALAQPAPVGEDETGVRDAERLHQEAREDFDNGTGSWGRVRDTEQALDAARALQPPKAETPAEVGDVRITSANGKHWRLEGTGWTMQPIGQVTANEARDICERALSAFSAAPAARPGGGVGLTLREAFSCADAEDWRRLDGFLGDSGHGRFWKAVFAQIRTELAAAPSADGGRA